MTLVRFTSPYFVAGVLADGDTIKVAAPILVWHARHCGWSVSELTAYAVRKGWNVESVLSATIG